MNYPSTILPPRRRSLLSRGSRADPQGQGKDPAAVALGRKGGKARAKSLTAKQRSSAKAAGTRIASRSKVVTAALAAAGIVAAGLLFQFFAAPPNSQRDSAEKPSFVGSETCAACHRKEGELWHASQHAHAMDHATDASVLGDFDDASLDYYGVHSRFFRKDGKFFVETDGADGKLADFEVKYTFGVYPLQQAAA